MEKFTWEPYASYPHPIKEGGLEIIDPPVVRDSKNAIVARVYAWGVESRAEKQNAKG